MNAKSNGNKSQLFVRCGKLFFRDVHKFLANYRDHGDPIFCSRNCQSKWIGEHYGFKSYPNHMGPGAKRKHNWEDVWTKYQRRAMALQDCRDFTYS